MSHVGRIAALAVIVAGCHAQPRARPPLPSAETRVAAAMAAWGAALERGDDDAVRAVEDGYGRDAFVYVAIKAAASQVDGGAEAVETTVFATVALAVLMTVFPGLFGAYPDDAVLVVVPTGPISVMLVDAGLAVRAPDDGGALSIVELPRDQTIERLEAAAARHRARLRERAAWTCRPTTIVRTIVPTEPSLVRGATISANVFAGWLRGVDAAWVVRADCASGPGLFVVTGHVDRGRGTAHDRILLAKVELPSGR